MTADQYTDLIDFLGRKFGGIDERFDALEGRLTKVEVGLESLRGDVQILAEGLTSLSQRLDRYHRDHEIRISALETRWFEA